MPRSLSRTLTLLLLSALSLLPRPAAAGVDRWTPLGPDGGAIQSLAVDPDRPGTVYAGTLKGGVWKSSDGGGHWSPLPEGLGSWPVLSLAVSPGRVWAATIAGLFVLTEEDPVWRSRSPWEFAGFVGVAVDPTNPDRIWALSSDLLTGAFLSEDAGAHWQQTLHPFTPFVAVAVAPTTPPTVYLSGEEGVFASTDTGATWREAPMENGFAISLDLEDPATVYATSLAGLEGSVWKTTDGGGRWSRLSSEVHPIPLLSVGGSLLGGTQPGMLRSEDDGATWAPVPELRGVNVLSVAADPFTPGVAWLGAEGQGVLRTLDSGRTWVASRRGLGATDIQAFAFDPFRPRTLYAAASLGGLQRSADAGASWSRLVPRTRLDIQSLAADPRQPGLLYAATARGVFVSRDRGGEWQQSLAEPRGILTVVVDPLRPGFVYAAGARLWRSRDGGRTWKRLPNPVAPDSVAVKIVFSPHHPGSLYLFQGNNNIFYPGGLWRSTDGGNTWQRIYDTQASSLAFDPQVPDLLYLGTGNGSVYRSRDGGVTWELAGQATEGLGPLIALLSDPVDPSILYAGSAGSGVSRSKDRGATWEPLTDGLIAPTITCLEADPRNPRHLVACTQGGGLLEIHLQP